MGTFHRVWTNINDVRLFGPSVMLRHFSHLKKDGMMGKAAARGSTIHLRKGYSDIAVVRQVFGNFEYEMRGLGKAWDRLQARYQHIIADGGTPVIVDAGANIGVATIWFKQQYPDAAVVAVEPDPHNASTLRMNVADLDNCHVMEAAIGSERGYVELSEPDLSWAVQTTRASSGVPIVTIQDALAQVTGGVLFIAKIDIEGFERDLFATNTGWIDDAAAIIIEPHDWMLQGEYSSVPFQCAMGTRRFEMFHSGENIFYVR